MDCWARTILENSTEKTFHVFFLGITLIFCLLTCTDTSRTARQTAKKMKVLLMMLRCIAVCGVCQNNTWTFLIYHRMAWVYQRSLSYLKKKYLTIPVPTCTSLSCQYQVRKWQTFGTNALWGAPQIVIFRKLLINLTDIVIFGGGGGLRLFSEF